MSQFPNPDAGPRLDGVRALIVDDDENVRRTGARMLSYAGAECTTAASCEAALAIIDSKPPDVLLADLCLPDRDGLDLIRSVRGREGSGRKLPAIVMTGMTDSDDCERCLAAGFNAYLAKPVDLMELLSAVAQVTGRDASRRSRSG